MSNPLNEKAKLTKTMYRVLCVSHRPFLFNCIYDVLTLLDLIDVCKNCIGRKQKHGHVSEVCIFIEGGIFTLFNIR